MRLSILSVVALAALVVTSCVPQKKYDELQNRFNSVYAENQGCQTELAASKTRVQSLEDMLNGVFSWK
mgnify:CR=1 FL=1